MAVCLCTPPPQPPQKGVGNVPPVISVIMGTLYRRDNIALLQRAVDSILAQRFSDWELLICDDGSSPAARFFLEEAERRDGRIRLIRRGDLLVLPAKLNACLRAAEGAYIARMDDDDFSHPDRLTKQLAFLQAHPDTAFVGCSVGLVQGGRPAGTRTFPAAPAVGDFYMTQPYVHPALLFRRACLDAVGGYSEDPRCILCEDYDLLLRLYEAGFTGANLQEILFDYTIPVTAKGSRRMKHRWNEAVTRFRRFRGLGVLPRAWPYVLKPLAVGLVPERLLYALKKKRENR